jgi:hypothetical protein
VLFAGRVGEDLLEPLVAGEAAGVLGRAGALARDAGRVGLTGLGLDARLDEKFVLLAIAEVVFVADTLAHLSHAGDPHRGLLQVTERAFRVGAVA